MLTCAACGQPQAGHRVALAYTVRNPHLEVVLVCPLPQDDSARKGQQEAASPVPISETGGTDGC
jgi:hypothetical protein